MHNQSRSIGGNLGEEQSYTDDPLKVYLAEVEKVPQLTRSEEIVCIRHVRACDTEAESAGKRLLEANLHLVVALAEQFRSHDVHMLDLIQAGNEGLIYTLQTLSEYDQASLAELATPHIESAIRRVIGSPERIEPSWRS